MKVRVINDSDGFTDLLPSWTRLYESLDTANVFYSPSWASLCFKHFLGESIPFLVVVEDKGVVIAIAPLKIVSRKMLGVRVNVLSHLNDRATDYANILIDRCCRSNVVLKKIFATIVQESKQWDLLLLDNFNSRDKSSRLLFEAASEAGIQNLGGYVNVITPFARLKVDEFSYDKKQLKDIERREKKLRELSKVDIYISSELDDSVWGKLVSFHSSRYPGKGFNAKLSQLFYSDVLADPELAKQVDFSFLTVDDSVVAAHFGFKDGNRVYYYVPSFDESYRKNAVGQILLKEMIFHYQRLGYETFDFLRGDEVYKNYWCDDTHLNYSFVGTSSRANFYISTIANIWICFKTVPFFKSIYRRLS